MTQLVIENLENDLRDKLQERARNHGRSVEEEVRDILRMAVEEPLSDEPGLGLGTRISRRFAGIGLEQDIPELRGHLVKPPSFDP